MECRVNKPELAKARYTTHAFGTATPDDFAMNASIQVPSGMGGMFTTVVTHIENGIATCEKPYDKDHGKGTFTVFINPPLIGVDEILSLPALINKLSINNPPTTDELALLHRARINGLLSYYNSWSFTETGVEVINKARDIYW